MKYPHHDQTLEGPNKRPKPISASRENATLTQIPCLIHPTNTQFANSAVNTVSPASDTASTAQ
jgi:hypothetical protein